MAEVNAVSDQWEDSQYLLNFWSPAVNDVVREEDSTEYHQIVKVEDDGVQVHLSGHNAISFVQDLIWQPTVERLIAVLVTLGAKVADNYAIVGTTSIALPGILSEYAGVIRQIRHLTTLQGKEDPIFQCLPHLSQ